MNRTWKIPAALAAAALLSTTACTAADGAESGVVPVAVGYQSKTINTVTAGTLMRELGLLDKHLAAAAEATGKTYDLAWHDFASGPPLTAEMIAGKIHIGSMGDFPLSVNGAKTAEFDDVKTDWVSVTGYNLRGSLNQIVVPNASDATSLADLEGKVISTSVGSTAHGNLVSALVAAGLTPEDVEIIGQDPPVGVTALESAQVDALAQFVPFPQRVIFSGEGRLLHDGNTGVPTFHGVIAASAYTEAHPEVLQAFLAAQREATEYLYEHPLESALMVAEATGLAPEVVYLYNGPNGAVTFDLTIKDELLTLVPFGTVADAEAYAADRPNATVVDYQTALDSL
jgi:NitT/TauT family transport system substrate-binding protein